MPRGERAHVILDSITGMGRPLGPGFTNEEKYNRLDEDAVNKALTTDGNTCPRCEQGLWVQQDFKSCVACGWSQEHEKPGPFDTVVIRPRRGFIDYSYTGKDEMYSRVILHVSIHTKANGYTLTTYRCPVDSRLKNSHRCGHEMKKGHASNTAGRVYLRCKMKHDAVALPWLAAWMFPWEVKL